MSQPWNLPEREVTPEKFLTRRRWLQRLGWGGLGAGVILGGGAGVWWQFGRAGTDAEVLGTTPKEEEIASGTLYPASLNPKFRDAGRPLTDEGMAARYCNFYEFAGTKDVWRYVEPFHPLPWTIEVTGLAAKPRKYDMDELLKAFPLEERIYRHRCVEAWAMVVPWTGFPLAALLKKVEPLPEAKYVRFVSFDHWNNGGKRRDPSQPWPYNEGLTLAEATNELAFISTGMYGHPLLKQHGAPVRVVVPWKYGFKSAKSIVRIELTDQRPATFWNTMIPHEYDFWANVNPKIPHPRWSQASERMLGTGERRPTLLYNGYEQWVAELYKT
jgi:sulfoxide reductase catalytic subunit YedY